MKLIGILLFFILPAAILGFLYFFPIHFVNDWINSILSDEKIEKARNEIYRYAVSAVFVMLSSLMLLFASNGSLLYQVACYFFPISFLALTVITWRLCLALEMGYFLSAINVLLSPCLFLFQQILLISIYYRKTRARD